MVYSWCIARFCATSVWVEHLFWPCWISMRMHPSTIRLEAHAVLSYGFKTVMNQCPQRFLETLKDQTWTLKVSRKSPNHKLQNARVYTCIWQGLLDTPRKDPIYSRSVYFCWIYARLNIIIHYIISCIVVSIFNSLNIDNIDWPKVHNIPHLKQLCLRPKLPSHFRSHHCRGFIGVSAHYGFAHILSLLVYTIVIWSYDAIALYTSTLVTHDRYLLFITFPHLLLRHCNDDNDGSWSLG